MAPIRSVIVAVTSPRSCVAGPRVPPEPLEQRLEQQHHQRHAGEREQREPERDLAQHHERRRHDHEVLEQRDQRGGDDGLGLVHLGDDARDELPGAGALEEAEVERAAGGRRCGCGDRATRPSCTPDRDLGRGVAQQVLEQQPDTSTTTSRPAAAPGREAGHQRLGQAARPALERGRAGAERAGGAEEVLEERHQEDEGEAVEQPRR